MNPVDLQQLVDRELKRLPTPKAPDTLLRRVLAVTVERPALPWYRRAWTAWPRQWQVASVAALLAVAVGLWFAIPLLQNASADAAWRSATAVPDRAVALSHRAGEIAAIVRLFWRLLLQPVAVYLFALAISLSLACALIWTALERLALGGAQQQ